MTNDEIRAAVEAMKQQCDLAMPTYRPVSARGVLYELNYTKDQADDVIHHLASRGFTYCLDPMIAATHFDPNNPKAVNDMVTDHPSSRACLWGPDQLKSRLWV